MRRKPASRVTQGTRGKGAVREGSGSQSKLNKTALSLGESSQRVLKAGVGLIGYRLYRS